MCAYGIDTAETTNYVYRPLETQTTIRILFLEPGCFHSPLRGQLRHIDLALTQRTDHGGINAYEALSYVWGEPAYDGVLETPNGHIWITCSLHEALRYLRYDVACECRVRVLWADALCINQEDVRERGLQVKLMGQVYSRASRVLVWLGVDCDYEAYKAFRAIREGFYHKRGETARRAMWQACMRILQLPWFSRLWVMQELLLAKCAVMLWGSESVGFEQFRFFFGINQIPLGLPSQRWLVFEENQHDFLGMLGLTRSLQCSDERDRVYALLGLKFPTTNSLTRAILGLEPNYTQPSRDLFFEIARLSVLHNRVVELLTSVCHCSVPDAAWPSWIPDWSRYPSFHRYDLETCYVDSDLPRISPTVDEDTISLTIQGVKIDTVAYVGDLELDPLNTLQAANQVTEFWACRVRDQDKLLNRGDQAWNFIQALTCNLWTDDGDRHWTDMADDVFNLHNPSVKLMDHLHDSPLAKEMFEFLKTHFRERIDCLHQSYAQHGVHGQYWHHRKLIQTVTGFVGLGPATSQVGDQVAVFSSPMYSEGDAEIASEQSSVTTEEVEESTPVLPVSDTASSNSSSPSTQSSNERTERHVRIIAIVRPQGTAHTFVGTAHIPGRIGDFDRLPAFYDDPWIELEDTLPTIFVFQ
ncbi:hypothetical protein ACN47E_002294 [Coniothyrium glycines]